jgi:hypothetical protein
MTSAVAAEVIKEQVTTAFPGPIVEANDFRLALETGEPFLLLLFPPTVHKRKNVGQPPLWEEAGSFAMRYHILSGDPVQPAREVIDGLRIYFREKQFPASDGTIVHTIGEFTGYESDEPVGGWYEIHLVVPFWRRYGE